MEKMAGTSKGTKRVAEEDLLTVPKGWKEPKFKKNDNPHGMLAESSFSIMFPRYREKYLKERWPLVKKKLGALDLKAELDLAAGKMSVSTTRKTWDPYAIINGRDCLNLLARSVPLEHALRVLEDENTCDVIKINTFRGSTARFVKRRQRLIGQDGSTLKAIELTTRCYVLVQGKTVATVGPHRGCREVRKIVEDCMKNIHPLLTVKMIMMKHRLAKREDLKNETWDRYLPSFKSKNVKRKVPKKQKTKKEYTPFPPPQLERKVDRELATGEYFLKQGERKAKKKNLEVSKKKKEEKERQKRQSFIPPKEK